MTNVMMLFTVVMAATIANIGVFLPGCHYLPYLTSLPV